VSEVEISLAVSDREAADLVAQAAKQADADSETSVGEQRGLAGGAAEWVAFLTLARPLIQPVLEAILYQVGLGKVTEIEVDGVKLKNPRKQDVEQLLEQHRGSAGE
jgi:hypothetical protein